MVNLSKQLWFGELHETTGEVYMARRYPTLDFAFALHGQQLIAYVVKTK